MKRILMLLLALTFVSTALLSAGCPAGDDDDSAADDDSADDDDSAM